MRLLTTAALMLSLATVSFAQPAKPAAPATQPVNKYCAVEGEPHAIDAAVTYVYEGKTYGFCCIDCVEAFKMNPKKYAAAAK